MISGRPGVHLHKNHREKFSLLPLLIGAGSMKLKSPLAQGGKGLLSHWVTFVAPERSGTEQLASPWWPCRAGKTGACRRWQWRELGTSGKGKAAGNCQGLRCKTGEWEQCLAVGWC